MLPILPMVQAGMQPLIRPSRVQMHDFHQVVLAGLFRRGHRERAWLGVQSDRLTFL